MMSWATWRARRKRSPNYQEAVEDRLAEAALDLENHSDRVASIAGFDWIVNIPLSAT